MLTIKKLSPISKLLGGMIIFLSIATMTSMILFNLNGENKMTVKEFFVGGTYSYSLLDENFKFIEEHGRKIGETGISELLVLRHPTTKVILAYTSYSEEKGAIYKCIHIGETEK